MASLIKPRRVQWWRFAVVVTGLFSLAGACASEDPISRFSAMTGANADTAVIGRVISIKNAVGSDLFTAVEIEVEEVVVPGRSGSDPGDRLTITVPGSNNEEFELWVSHAPRFTVGETFVGFLKREGETMSIAAGYRGKRRWHVIPGENRWSKRRRIWRSLKEDPILAPVTARVQWEVSEDQPPLIEPFEICSSNGDPTGADAAIARGALRWTYPRFGLFFKSGCKSSGIDFDGVNRIDFGVTPSGYISAAWVWILKSTGIVVECDIRFRSPPTTGTSWHTSTSSPAINTYDLESYAAHEVGHCIGLLEEGTKKDSVMVPAGPKIKRRDLAEPDDESRRNSLYGPGH